MHDNRRIGSCCRSIIDGKGNLKKTKRRKIPWFTFEGVFFDDIPFPLWCCIDPPVRWYFSTALNRVQYAGWRISWMFFYFFLSLFLLAILRAIMMLQENGLYQVGPREPARKNLSQDKYFGHVIVSIDGRGLPKVSRIGVRS